MQGGEGEESGVPIIVHSRHKTSKLSCPIAINHANVIKSSLVLQVVDLSRMINVDQTQEQKYLVRWKSFHWGPSFDMFPSTIYIFDLCLKNF